MCRANRKEASMLVDPRITKMAELLVRYSLGVREGDLCWLRATPAAGPLVQECYRQVLLAGGQPPRRSTPARPR